LRVGALRAEFQGANDGRAARVGFTLTNTRPERIERLGVRLVIANPSHQEPWCVGGPLTAITHVGVQTVCQVRVDAPAYGVVRVEAGVGTPPPPTLIAVRFGGPGAGAEGAAIDASATLRVFVKNAGAAETSVTPLLRLAGETVPYRVVQAPGPAGALYTLRLRAGQEVELKPVLDEIAAPPGVHELQVYLRDTPAWAPVCQRVTLPVPAALTSPAESTGETASPVPPPSIR
jgi:hypothetical protein